MRAKGLLLILALVGVLAADRQAADSSSPLVLLYVGANDCGPCLAWRNKERSAFLANVNGSRLDYREVIASRTAEAFRSSVWPQDLQNFRPAAERLRGVPLWLVIRGDKIVATGAGLSSWPTTLALLARERALSR